MSPHASQIAGEVIEFNPDDFLSKKAQRREDLYCHYAMAAAKMAIVDAGLEPAREDSGRVGVIVASGIGGLQSLQVQHRILMEKGPERCSPFMIPQMICNMASGLIAIEFQFKGPNYAVVSACASASHALGDAMRLIQYGDADMMISGGSDAGICSLAFAGFCALRALSTRNAEPEKASRPFDKERDGFVIGEGAGCLVLEELEHAHARGARIYAELAGAGMSSA